ncbi:photosynthetic complex putative assembly protein PuhB [Acuticoccus sp. MNP-M23]|uniref:photosynthetic complex putative assembly protein PuhB n=1 Tax=Acuticoccus sp. MNP-M23 TaxID=3072793 RepID=UPI0028150B2E|nr:photosynthetic complex putative assembly protein PuhB [Acuticoccus sp. MNP-M23]WMS42705.1 photosynthetic complex putative assembly protein PuhB [Acuticoccus sp. MNP-M23]
MSAERDEIAAHDDFDHEPTPGLPEALPEGERVLWSGAPDWKAFALDVFHVRAIALYGLAILVWRVGTTIYDGGGIGAAFGSATVLMVVFGVCLGLLAVLALVTARSTRYTITNRRVVMRIGVALTMSVNLPFKQILSANYRDTTLGTGGIALSMAETGGLGYLVLWPHARPFRISRPEPMLRGIKDGERVARILSNALAASHGRTAPELRVSAPVRSVKSVAA